jgi:hypothetical protein
MDSTDEQLGEDVQNTLSSVPTPSGEPNAVSEPINPPSVSVTGTQKKAVSKASSKAPKEPRASARRKKVVEDNRIREEQEFEALQNENSFNCDEQADAEPDGLDSFLEEAKKSAEGLALSQQQGLRPSGPGAFDMHRTGFPSFGSAPNEVVPRDSLSLSDPRFTGCTPGVAGPSTGAGASVTNHGLTF